MFRRLILIVGLLVLPAGLLAQAPCPVGTNGSGVVLVNDSTTGTTANKLVALTSAGNAILFPHAQASGVVGVAYNGAGSVPNSGVCVQQTGSIPIIADGAVTIQHWVTTSTTTDGNIHDTGVTCPTLPPSGVEIVGCAVTASSGAGVAALIALKSTSTSTLNRRSCDIAVGDTSSSTVIANAQLGPQKRICYVPLAITIQEVDVAADGGTPNVIVGVNHAGTTTNLLSAALATAASGGIACSKTTAVTCIDGATTASATLQNNTAVAGDYLELVSGTAGGVAKLMTIHIVYTVN